jgi:hypothetical protein
MRVYVVLIAISLSACTNAYARSHDDDLLNGSPIDVATKSTPDITEQSPTEHTIKRAAYNTLLDRGEIGAHASVESKDVDGGPPLLFVRGLVKSDVGYKVGLRNGDRLVSVMGQPVGSPVAAFQIYAAAQSTTLATATVARGKKMVNLVLHIVP